MAEVDRMAAKCRRKAKFRQYLAAFLANLSSFSIGTMLGWTSPMQPLLSSTNPPVGSEPMSTEFISWIGSINYIGSIFGTFFWGIFSDRLGRKYTAIIVAFPFLISWIIKITAQNGWWLLVARFVMGVGCSGVTINTPIYVAEIADSKIRGSLGSFVVIFLNAGCLFANVVGSVMSYHGVAAVCMSVPIIFLLIFPIVRESPVYLWNRGKRIEAEQSILWFRGGDTIEAAKEVEALEQRPRKSFDAPSYKDLISTRGVRRAMVISIGFIIGQQFCGFLAIVTFSVKIFQDSGSSLSAYNCMIIVGVLQLLSALTSSFFIDRAGRRILLILSYLAMSLSLTTLGGYLYFKNDSWSSILRLIPVSCLSIFVIFFAIGVGPVPFVVMSEIFPPNIRGFAMSKIQMLGTTSSFITVKTFPFLTKLLGSHGCFLFYATFCAALCIFTCVNVPETKGKSLHVIQKELNGKDVSQPEDSESKELYEVKKVRIVKEEAR